MTKDREIQKLKVENQVLRDKIKSLTEKSRQLTVNLNVVKAENANLQNRLWRVQVGKDKKPKAPDTE